MNLTALASSRVLNDAAILKVKTVPASKNVCLCALLLGMYGLNKERSSMRVLYREERVSNSLEIQTRQHKESDGQ
jgi:hypothetical protein